MFQVLNENNFENEIKNGLKLVDFYANWCGYCEKQQVILVFYTGRIYKRNPDYKKDNHARI